MTEFEPKIVAFLCNWCAYRGADLAGYFMCEEEPMYTKRESELLQQYISQHGQMPEGNRELEDLF